MRRNLRQIRLAIFCLLGLLCVPIAMQAQSFKQFVKKGDESYEKADYYNAAFFYTEALRIDSNQVAVKYKFAESSRKTNDYKAAIQAYRFVSQNDEAKEFPLSVFWLAEMLKISGNYAKAIFNFQSFVDNYRGNDYYQKKAIQELASCNWAREHITDSVAIAVEHLEGKVNSGFSDFAASEIGDSLLQMSSLNSAIVQKDKTEKYYSRIYLYKPGENGWEPHAGFLDSFNNKEEHVANGSFSEDLQSFFFTLCDNEGGDKIRCAIYKCSFMNGVWSAAVKLDSNINQNGSTSTHPYEGRMGNNKVLFFSSDRIGTKGGLDLWMSREQNGQYGPAENLGEQVNSPDDEITPFFHAADQNLYFSSTWPYGYGGFDVFKSEYKNGRFDSPKNMSKPVNTSYNDLYFNFKKGGKEAFISSNRPGARFLYKEACCNDIFKLKWTEEKMQLVDTSLQSDTPRIALIDSTELKKKVIEQKLQSLIPLVLFFHNDEPDPRSERDSSNLRYDEAFASYMQRKEEYFASYSNDDPKSPISVQQLFSGYVEPGMAKLESFAALMAAAFAQGRTVEITIQAYCSPLAKNAYNIRLAGRRIASLKNYLSHYQSGVFKRFVENGQLRFVHAPFGEEKADQTISDNRLDLPKSVYNPRAALERRVEIIAVELK